jgi:superfamily I DNA and/or RNA helicase
MSIALGDPVFLWRENGEQTPVLSGILLRRKQDRLAIVIDSDDPNIVGEGNYCLEFAPPLKAFEYGTRAIEKFYKAEKSSIHGHFREILFGNRKAAFHNNATVDPCDKDLNRTQIEAVSRAMSAQDLFLLYGYPGTGKTRTLVEIIRQAVARGERVLATAASFTAIDNLLERLGRADLNVVRLGHSPRFCESMEACSLDALLETTDAYELSRRWIIEANALLRRIDYRSSRQSIDTSQQSDIQAEIAALLSDARRERREAKQNIIDRSSVICGTVLGIELALSEDKLFDLVVIDDATQLSDPLILVALARGSRAVLAGDPHQWTPKLHILQRAIRDLSYTLFQRLCYTQHGDMSRILTTQYRMNKDIMHFPSLSIYLNHLISASEARNRRLEDLPGVQKDPQRPAPLYFLDTAGKAWDEEYVQCDPQAVFNPQQAQLTAQEVRRLLRRGLRPDSIAVITPYQTHISVLWNLLAQEIESGLEIGQAEMFQGREKEAIIIDLVHSNDQARIGSLRDINSINVALTRARRFLLLIGDSATIGTHPFYAYLLSNIEQRGYWISAWHDEP